jgi:hypothetical protein
MQPSTLDAIAGFNQREILSERMSQYRRTLFSPELDGIHPQPPEVPFSTKNITRITTVRGFSGSFELKTQGVLQHRFKSQQIGIESHEN